MATRGAISTFPRHPTTCKTILQDHTGTRMQITKLNKAKQALRPPSDWRRPAGRPRTTWLRTYSHRILGSTRHGGRQGREILSIRSSVRQRSARSSPPRRRSCCHNYSNYYKPDKGAKTIDLVLLVR